MLHRIYSPFSLILNKFFNELSIDSGTGQIIVCGYVDMEIVSYLVKKPDIHGYPVKHIRLALRKCAVSVDAFLENWFL